MSLNFPGPSTTGNTPMYGQVGPQAADPNTASLPAVQIPTSQDTFSSSQACCSTDNQYPYAQYSQQPSGQPSSGDTAAFTQQPGAGTQQQPAPGAYTLPGQQPQA